jgi:hypothetical protein
LAEPEKPLTAEIAEKVIAEHAENTKFFFAISASFSRRTLAVKGFASDPRRFCLGLTSARIKTGLKFDSVRMLDAERGC